MPASIATEPFHRLFHLPLLEEAFVQMGLLKDLLSNQNTGTGTYWWSYIWGTSFSSRKAYKQHSGHAQLHASFQWL